MLVLQVYSFDIHEKIKMKRKKENDFSFSFVKRTPKYWDKLGLETKSNFKKY